MPDPPAEDAASRHKRWNDYFRKQQPDAVAVRELVLALHEDALHADVVAVLEAALLLGQSQPWMYEVLAISMRLSGRPKHDVERVLLSRVDFTATDVASMLYAAAYLKRFGADEAALRLYRQASNIAPERPESWVMALRLAQKLKDWNAVGDTAAGVLTHTWVRDHARLHRDAENAAEDARRALIRAGHTAAADVLVRKLNEARKRDLRLKLTWNGLGDLDLIVEEPLGTVCSQSQPYSPGGGVHVHDGSGPDQRNCYDEYVCPQAASGTYRVHIRHIRGNIVGKRALLTAIRHEGTDDESTSRVSIELSSDDVVVRVPLSNGRRKKASSHVSDARLRGIVIAPENDHRVSSADVARSRAARQQFLKSRRDRDGNLQAGVMQNVDFQPVVTAIPEGASLGASAVVSADRRYVRLSLTPSFSSLTDLVTFSFLSFGSNPGGTAGGR